MKMSRGDLVLYTDDYTKMLAVVTAPMSGETYEDAPEYHEHEIIWMWVSEPKFQKNVSGKIELLGDTYLEVLGNVSDFGLTVEEVQHVLTR